ncbi:MAG TPA: STAS domain-containing protein [Chloroflexus aurantiacus]|jgi:anti-anti-sigma factor|uniref:Sulfate transporter/antisigma-factor antagonist STAS n=1 Tax=Chloroflexus aurantiacus (strain ATCC 29366 / DSM 635 / J-10-fl) TaxID=324602 RepID=A9WD32_CHLAA|nr:STAS domain-containing protein [Chloroflexus aurantiacus]ABY34999.1 Sulfate transporter/antisigma-factor antagonist STAS [Chloroflexus aurantiacus J-10-fl]RMG52175.1 MAG: STAS domain-containing protein [Chloroflexota bacterium]GIV92617.1 MAG: anti-sigma factor antagonist [Chloroflexus sp.]HBW68789.1 STAS domain-containing protein [Chloroflexus aurantiacus]
MQTSQSLLDQFFRQIARSIALGIGVIAAVVVPIELISFVLTNNTLLAIAAAISTTIGIGSGCTVFLLDRGQPLWQGILPFAVLIVVAEIMVALWLPELYVSAAPFIVVAILLASLINRRVFTISVLVICIVVTVVLLLISQPAPEAKIPAPMFSFLQASSLAALFVAVWIFLDRIIAAQMQALQIADQRADDAEAARQQTELARQEVERRASEQQRLLELVAVLELPILTIDDRVLLAPLVGNLDSRRADALRQRVLERLAELRAHTVIIDITGITVIDTAVAKALIDTATAIRLLGARTIISGIRPTVAQTLVHLNTGLHEITTAPNPEAALRLARPAVMI